MQKTITQPKMITLAGAVLAIAALVAALMLLGGTPAGAQSDSSDTTDDTDPPRTHAQPEDCVKPHDPVVSSGRIALFDMYWNAEGENLAINPCPPTVTHHAKVDATPFTDEIPAWDERVASDIDIAATTIHVPSKYRHQLSLTSTADQQKYPFMFLDNLDSNGEPVSDNNPGDGVYDALVSDYVWVLPTCDPNHPKTAGASDLCLFFSATLLEPSDWRVNSEAQHDELGDVLFEFESIREPGIGPDDRGYAFVFYPSGSVPNGEDQVTWRTDDVSKDKLSITPGTYEYRQWAFAERGTYVFQVQAKGYPVPALITDEERRLKEKTSTSQVAHYIIHVGLLAEFTVDITASDTAPSVGDTVTFEIEAHNEGPGEVHDAKLDITIPDGLTFVSATTSDGSYDSPTHTWDVGTVVAPAQPSNPGDDPVPTTVSMTITATVDEGTRGQDLVVSAVASVTEEVGSSVVDELDPHGHHHRASITVTPTAQANAPLEFYLSLDVPENSPAETKIGDPILIRGDDPDDVLTYTLHSRDGHGASLFTASEVTGGVQIAMRPGAILDYESFDYDTVFDFDLQVSDGKDEDGNPDPSVDSSIPVQINITDDRTEAFAVRLSVSNSEPTVGDQSVVFTITLDNETPEGFDRMTWKWTELHDDLSGGHRTVTDTGTGNPGNTRSPVEVPTREGEVTYSLSFSHTVNEQEQKLAESNGVTVTWLDDSSSN